MKFASDGFADRAMIGFDMSEVGSSKHVGSVMVTGSASLMSDADPAMRASLEQILQYSAYAYGLWSLVRRREQKDAVESNMSMV